jgi:cytochrome c biogenesis protein CcmG, thiol:disulfide interchange protein DsbE
MTKTKTLLFLLLLLSSTMFVNAQGISQLPSVTIKTLQGQEVNTRDLSNEGKPYVISFWATWCRPCLKELTAIDEIYDQWQHNGFKLIAISTDDARTRPNVLPMVRGRGWEFEFFMDENGDLRRAMGVNLVPHTFILNGKGEIVSQHTAFSEGMEWEMLDKLNELLNADE